MQYLGTIITFFAPGLIAVCIEEYIRKKANEQHEEISFKKAFFSWACYSYLITLCIGTIKYVEGWGSWLYADTINQVSNVVKYGALSIFFAISFVVIHNMRPLLSIFSSVYPSQSTLKKCKNSNIRLKTSEKYFYVFISSCASLLVLFFWTKGNYKIYDFNMGTIAFSYQYGFICRGLIGTCINLFANALGVSVSAHLIEQIFFIITILLIVVLIMFIFGTGIRADRLFDADVAKCIWYIGFVFIIGIGLSTFFVDWGRTDMLMLMLSLASCWFAIVDKNIFLIIPLVVICALIHEGYIFMYAGILCATLLYRILCCIESKNRKRTKKYVCILMISITAPCALFFYFYFIARPTSDLLYISVLKRTLDIIKTPTDDFINVIYAIQGQLFGERWSYAGTDVLAQRIAYLVPTLIELCPFIIIFFLFWKSVWSEVKNYNGSILKKLFYYLVPFGGMATVPLFIFHMDYWRWYYQVCFYEIFIVLVLTACGDIIIAHTLKKGFSLLCRFPNFFAALALYSVVLGPFRNEGFLLNTSIVNGLKAIFVLF